MAIHHYLPRLVKGGYIEIAPQEPVSLSHVHIGVGCKQRVEQHALLQRGERVAGFDVKTAHGLSGEAAVSRWNQSDASTHLVASDRS